MSRRTVTFTGFLLIAALLIAPAAAFAKDALQAEENLTGTVFHDANQDGVFDEGEVGIPGVTIDITGPDSFAASTVTDENGEYGFTLVDAGDYTVTETNPTGYLSTTADEATVSFDGSTPEVANFGDVPEGEAGTGVIEVTVYEDVDRSRDLSEGDQPLAGAGLALMSGVVDATPPVTGEDGTASFEGLLPGTYTVLETDPEGYYSTTSNSVEVTIGLVGSVASAEFFDFMPEEGEVSDHELLLWEYFDVLMIDVLKLRDDLGWGFGNIARALFVADLYDIPLSEILDLREGEMQGWGNILRSLIGHASLKGYNWGLIVSGRGEPNGNFNNGDMKKAEACGFEGEEGFDEYMDLVALHGKGLMNRACKLAERYDVDVAEVIALLESDMNMKEIKEELNGEPGSLEASITETDDESNGNGNGPPPCKGWRKNDEGC